MHEGLIYAYPHYVGQVQLSRGLQARHREHLKKHPEWPFPLVAERVFGKDRKDLIFNLAWQETIWMFKLHTYQKIWKEGLNLCCPHAQDYSIHARAVGSLGGRRVQELYPGHLGRAGKIGGKIGGKRVHELHPDHWKRGALAMQAKRRELGLHPSFEICSKGGKANLGVKRSEIAKKNMSAAAKKRGVLPETLRLAQEAARKSNTGRKRELVLRRMPNGEVRLGFQRRAECR